MQTKSNIKLFPSMVMMITGRFPIYPVNLSPWVEWGQNVVWSRNNPNHDPQFFINPLIKDVYV